MVKPLRKITFLIEDMSVGSPAQQLLDRFLMGYPRDGAFHRPEGCQVYVWTASESHGAELALRINDFGLVREADLKAAVAGANGIVVVPRDANQPNSESLLKPALATAAPGAALFVHGVLGVTLPEARQYFEHAAAKKISLLSGTSIATTWRLPEVDVPAGTPLEQALIVVQGAFPQGELDALEGLLPLIERRPRAVGQKGRNPSPANSGIRRLRYLEGPELWQAGEQKHWSWTLLAAAISRSDSPQGDPARDGRTQDIVGLRLVPRLALQPRGWLLEHGDGLRSAVLVLDGVVADFNFAVQTRGGDVISAQLYRPPAPDQHQFSRLAACVEDFLCTGRAPWPPQRSLLTTGLLEVFRQMRTGGIQEWQAAGLR